MSKDQRGGAPYREGSPYDYVAAEERAARVREAEETKRRAVKEREETRRVRIEARRRWWQENGFGVFLLTFATLDAGAP